MLNALLKPRVRHLAHVFFLISILSVASPLLANPGPAVALAWDPSTDASVAGYNVYYGTASRSYTNVVPAGSANSAVVSNLVTGVTYYFAATTFTVAGLESDYSVEAAYAVPTPNTPPTLDALASLAINQDTGEQVVTLTGITSGATNEVQTLAVSAFSSNPGLIPNPAVSYSSPDTTGTLTFSPAPGSFGSAIITVMVDDGAAISNTVIRSFTVAVTPVDNPPTIDLLSDVVLNQNAGLQMLSLTGISAGSTNENATLTVTAISSNPNLIPAPNITYTSPSSTGTLAFSPVTNATGTARITVTVSDSQPTNNSASMSFRVTVNQTVAPPGLLASVTISPNATFCFLLSPPATNSDKFNTSLASGAPTGAKITSRRGYTWLIWTPTTSQASTTNLIGINITDTSNPGLSTNQTVQVIVLDYLTLVLGSASLQAGQSGAVPLALSSSDGVTSLSFKMGWPTKSLPNPTLAISAAGVASSSLVNQTTNWVVTVQMAPGQALLGSNVIGSILFQSLATQPSGYVNLPVSNVTAFKPTSLPYTSLVPTAGQVAFINNQAMVQATALTGPTRRLTILGKVGNTYQVQYCTNLAPGALWSTLLTYNQTNVSQSFNLDPTVPQVLYRVQQK